MHRERMSGFVLPVSDVTATVYTVPTDKPESDGTLEWDSTTMIAVHVRSGDLIGFGTRMQTTAPRTWYVHSWPMC